MRLPIGSVDGRILNGIAAVEHYTVTDINADMRNAGSIVCADKEDKIARLRVAVGNRGTDIVKPLSAKPPGVDQPAIGEDIRDKA